MVIDYIYIEKELWIWIYWWLILLNWSFQIIIFIIFYHSIYHSLSFIYYLLSFIFYSIISFILIVKILIN